MFIFYPFLSLPLLLPLLYLSIHSLLPPRFSFLFNHLSTRRLSLTSSTLFHLLLPLFHLLLHFSPPTVYTSLSSPSPPLSLFHHHYYSFLQLHLFQSGDKNPHKVLMGSGLNAVPGRLISTPAVFMCNVVQVTECEV